MRFGMCSWERELAELLERGQWPEACPAELRAHVAACGTCSERLVVTQAMRRERAVAAGAARLESPGVIWWRAQLRRRNAAIERISRPILGAQIFAAAVALVAAIAFFATQARQSMQWLSWFAEIPRSLHLEALLPAALQNGAVGAWLMTALLAVLAVIGGVAAYASSDKG